MKFVVQQKKKQESFLVEVPARSDLSYVSPGDLFDVLVSKDGKQVRKDKACFLADRRSILLGNTVVRIKKHVTVGSRGTYRLGVKLAGEGAITQNSFLVVPLKPIEPKKSQAAHGGGDIKSPMTGKLIAICVQEGARVQEGEPLVVIEAMKMENRILAECSGVVKNIRFPVGTNLSTKDILLTLDPSV